MPLYDHRVFRHRREWWIAEVHSASGAGAGPHIRVTDDRVTFTCMSDENRPSLTTTIPTGWLNRMAHSSIAKLLEQARPYGSRFEMYPYNAPDAAELETLQAIVDDEGLRWVVRRLPPPAPGALAVVVVTCLDDSALKRDIMLQPGTVYEDAKVIAPFDVDDELVKAVKGTFPVFEPRDDDED